MFKKLVYKAQDQLLSKQVLKAEIDQLKHQVELPKPQLSVHVLESRNLPASEKQKVKRYVRISVGSQKVCTQAFVTKGNETNAKWMESFLFEVDLDNKIKLAVCDEEQVIGGVILLVRGFADQLRHDGWYHIGCGKVRLSIRLIVDAESFLNQLMLSLNESILSSENLLEKSESKPLKKHFCESDFEDLQIESKANVKLKSYNFLNYLLRQASLFLLKKSKRRHKAASIIQKAFKTYKERLVKSTLQSALKQSYSYFETLVYIEVRTLFMHRLNEHIKTLEKSERQKELEKSQTARRRDTIQKLRRSKENVNQKPSEVQSVSAYIKAPYYRRRRTCK